jgi:hypothetical protein
VKGEKRKDAGFALLEQVMGKRGCDGSGSMRALVFFVSRFAR